MTRTPRVSIGLPVYNGETFLAESLESLLGQSFTDFELIISDNASTDRTADICRWYSEQDCRIRYIRQPQNIGLVPNHSSLVASARGELFKWASDDDLYARDLIERCVEALDEHPQVVLAHSRAAMIDSGRVVKGLFDERVAADAERAPDRFRSMLFDGWDDYTYGVIRTRVLRGITPRGSYHYADRTLNTELALWGPFQLVPECLYFRREHAGRPPQTVRSRCALLDPRRADRRRHPLVRLYGEYVWGYVSAIRNAPLSAADRWACYRWLGKWLADRARPVASRTFRGNTLESWKAPDEAAVRFSIDEYVAVAYGRGAWLGGD